MGNCLWLLLLLYLFYVLEIAQDGFRAGRSPSDLIGVRICILRYLLCSESEFNFDSSAFLLSNWGLARLSLLGGLTLSLRLSLRSSTIGLGPWWTTLGWRSGRWLGWRSGAGGWRSGAGGGGSGEEAGLFLGGGAVSCLLRQPRYRFQEVRVPFERIGRVLDQLMPGMRVMHGHSRVLLPPQRLNLRVRSGTGLLEPPPRVPTQSGASRNRTSRG
ncbi:MAG: hypothetical protein CM15mP6_3140 [Methanobacteriota archaeon]|nr:MAG: hypothetical protein CM15mP6_3140 [Euryarchaeota archaeon]